MIRARYDAAQTNDDNRRTWSDADALSARAANSPEVRRTLRNRARYERANNSYLDGMTQTLANDTVGTGPRLQLLTADPQLNRRVELDFTQWANHVRLASKLRTMRMAKVIDGEAFALLTFNPRLPTPVKLDVKLVEAEQIATPFPYPTDPLRVDGMTLDEHDNPIEYNLLRTHPGDLIAWGFPYQFDKIPARHVIHWFRADRPNQWRGIPEITPALIDFPELRRYSRAVLAAAETAADFAALLYSDAAADDEGVEGTPFETLPIAKRMMTTIPAGHRVEQLRAEHPKTEHPQFERATLNRIARCLNMPLNVALANSSNYNYASGRLDHQIYYKAIRVEQSDLRLVVLDRLLNEWLLEAQLATDLLAGYSLEGDVPHHWFWDSADHVDPQKEADAQATRLQNGTTTYAIEYGRMGRDWEVEFEQLALEARRRQELGILGNPTPAPTRPTTPEQEGDDDPVDD